VPQSACQFDFQIFHTEAMTKVAPNTQVLSGGNQGAWTATIPPGTNQPLCVMKYKVATDLNQAKRQVPLQLNIAWACTKKTTTIDVDYALQPQSNTKLIDVKFLIGEWHDGCTCALWVTCVQCV
jgi:hypothetical protein